MIEGKAQIEALNARAKRFPGYQTLGKTRFAVSSAGFGCYRVARGQPRHEKALKQALTEGVNLIDTSSNYADGLSEQMVGHVLGEMIQSGDLSREEVVIVSKVGYLQGQNYDISQSRKLEGKPFPDLVELGQDLEHCIHPEFLEDQLDRSRTRLNCQTIDVYLLHNPEYYLDWAESAGLSREEADKEYYRRLGLAFEYLEKEAAAGRISYYGVSSNTFPHEPSKRNFTSLEKVWELACALSPNHQFRGVQFPRNLVERGAAVNVNQSENRTLLDFCREHQIGSLINRPLNAIVGGRLLRLAEVDTFVPQTHPQYQVMVDQGKAIKNHIAQVDKQWAQASTLSRIAFRSLRSTQGIHSVLVGMRHPNYVKDVIEEMKTSTEYSPRETSWSGLKL